MRNKIKGNYAHENAKKALRAVAKSNGHSLGNFQRGQNHDINHYAYCQKCKSCAVIGGVNQSINRPCKVTL